MTDAGGQDAMTTGRRPRVRQLRRGVRLAAVTLGLTLVGCGPLQPHPSITRGVATASMATPPVNRFPPYHGQPPTRSNAQLARDFMELSFSLETGVGLTRFSRFEGPITVTVAPGAPPTLLPDLDRLLARLRDEAGLDITRVAGPDASITINPVRRADMRGDWASAACFVTPRVSTFAQVRRARPDVVDWTTLTQRRKMAIVIPADIAPQEIRDCLNEELAQSLGLPNDLYRLPHSVYNDDNFVSLLTGFDMLMLRATYDPSLHAGMSRAEVAARIPGIIARLNPGGGPAGMAPPDPTPRAWLDSIDRATDPRAGDRRLAAARRAVDIATREGWRDERMGFALFQLGRLSMASDPGQALRALNAAHALYVDTPGMQLQDAFVAMQLASYALSAGDPRTVTTLVDGALPAARQAQNAALMVQLLLRKAEALAMENRGDEADALRSAALGFAGYGFGSPARIETQARNIAALAARPRRVASN